MEKFIFMIMLILIISSAGAYYPGQKLTFNNKFDTTNNIDYEIIGNSTILPELDIDVTEEEIEITLPSDMIPQTFHIIFVEQDVREVEVEKVVEEIVYRDKEVVTVKTNGLNATQYQKIIDMNKTAIKPKNYVKSDETKSRDNYIWYAIGFVGFFMIILLIGKIINRVNNENET